MAAGAPDDAKLPRKTISGGGIVFNRKMQDIERAAAAPLINGRCLPSMVAAIIGS
jgi:hypothetical protein